jgi:hypothetical protein
MLGGRSFPVARRAGKQVRGLDRLRRRKREAANDWGRGQRTRRSTDSMQDGEGEALR